MIIQSNQHLNLGTENRILPSLSKHRLEVAVEMVQHDSQAVNRRPSRFISDLLCVNNSSPSNKGDAAAPSFNFLLSAALAAVEIQDTILQELEAQLLEQPKMNSRSPRSLLNFTTPNTTPSTVPMLNFVETRLVRLPNRPRSWAQEADGRAVTSSVMDDRNSLGARGAPRDAGMAEREFRVAKKTRESIINDVSVSSCWFHAGESRMHLSWLWDTPNSLRCIDQASIRSRGHAW